MSESDPILVDTFLMLLGATLQWLPHVTAQPLEGILQMIRDVLVLLSPSLVSYYFFFGLAVPVAVLKTWFL